MSGVRDKLGIHEFDARDFEIVPVTVHINGLDPEFNNYKIAHISDIHLGQWISAKRIEGVVNLVNKQKPDIVAITWRFCILRSQRTNTGHVKIP